MARYIGPGLLPRGAKKYMYRMTKDNLGYLTFTKVDLELDEFTLTFNDTADRDVEVQQEFPGFDVDQLFDNITEEHLVINETLGITQIRFSHDDLLYWIDDDGYLVVRINGNRDYPAEV
jgi:hypothetical protein